MKTRLKFIIPIVIVALLSALCIISEKFTENETPEDIVIKSPSDISRIEIKTGEYIFQEFQNYTIDFDNNIFTHKIQNTDKEKITNFSDEDKENFVRKANIYGFFGWKELYDIGEVEDGGYTKFLITYSDGSQQKISCYNKYPDTYSEVWNAIYEIFGDCII